MGVALGISFPDPHEPDNWECNFFSLTKLFKCNLHGFGPVMIDHAKVDHII